MDEQKKGFQSDGNLNRPTQHHLPQHFVVISPPHPTAFSLFETHPTTTVLWLVKQGATTQTGDIVQSKEQS